MAKDPSKTEAATPKRRQKTREEGNVPKSQEVAKTITIFAGAIGLFIYIGPMIDRLRVIFTYFMSHAVDMPLEKTDAYRMLYMIATELAIIVLPVMAIILFAVFIIMRLQVGKLWTTKVFKFKWENFNIFKGIQRMFLSPQTFVRLFKSLAFACIIGYIPFTIIKNEFPNFLPMYYMDAAGVGYYMLQMGFKLTIYTLAPMVIIAIFDLWYTRHQYEENMKMSKQEVKEEHKQQDGDPIIKSKQKQKMMQIMSSRMMQDVPKADVVVTNPTHFAVALSYDPTVSPAPIVIAKGVDSLALKIKEIAIEHKIPIRENKPLAQALYKQVEVGQTIPEELYKAVAALLAEIWRMKGKIPHK